MRELWAGTDAGKGEHHCTVVDANGTKIRVAAPETWGEPDATTTQVTDRYGTASATARDRTEQIIHVDGGLTRTGA
ncbi:hypothetical protein ACIGXM_20790 [Kitasatospora sp. NPDC052896]|uniref:hypothetical protein n=1 Tax=Kitasatospora sp. NPDC052896 TaxID=3364061 RepID=UPI0037C5CAAC